MKMFSRPVLLKIVTVTGLTMLLILLALGSLAPLQPVPAWASSGITNPLAPPAPGPWPLAPGPRPLASLSIANTAVTAIDPNGAQVYNGDFITYTIIIANSGDSVKEIEVQDFLAADVLNDVTCLTEQANCVYDVVTTTINARGFATQITQTVKVGWRFSETDLASKTFPMVLQFRGRVLCQPEGSTFTNQAFLNYTLQNGTPGSAISNPPVETTVGLRPLAEQGRFSISTAPELCTQNGPKAGTADMDWGDFDNDGDLDAAFVSYDGGIFVYRNKGLGQFELLWNDASHRTEGVHWANFDGDSNGYLELVVSGDYTNGPTQLPEGGTYSFKGLNYLYRYNGTSFVQYDDFFTNDGAWRFASADFTGDGYPDLAALSYWGGCVVQLYKNNGSGFFNLSPADSSCLNAPPYHNYNGSDPQAYSAAWGDVDNDGQPDLAVGYLSDGGATTFLRVFRNNTNSLTYSSYIDVGSVTGPPASFKYPYSMAWGDYDGDGNLDLAVAFASRDRYYSFAGGTGGFRVYHNDGGSFSQASTPPGTGAPVGALDWADFDGDGLLDLIIAEYNQAPRIYKYTGGNFTLLTTMNLPGKGSILGVRGVDIDGDADLDIAFTNYLASNWLFTVRSPFLQQYAKGLVPSFVSHSVAWGDVNTDGDLDLLFGTDTATKLYRNNNDGTFFGSFAFSPNPQGVRSAALGDVEGDGDLDIALGFNGQNWLYPNNGGGTFPVLPTWIAAPSDETYDLFFIDANQDNLSRPDLVVGNRNNPNRLYINGGSALATSPAWESSPSGPTRDVAWAFLNSDILPDLAGADEDQGTRVYRNTGYESFTLVQTLATSATQAVAWADYDNDGDMDLAVGMYGRANRLYQNNSGTLSLVWTAPVTRNTTSLAWGDWDNDGDPDLAVGNYNQKDQVYTNLGSTTGQVSLAWLWEAAANYKTTALTWVDYDRDGDLDLSLSQETTSDPNGIYENTYVAPAHLVPDFASYVPLPRTPNYLYVAQPGNPGQLFRRSVLTDPTSLTIPITITAYDPDTSRAYDANLNGNWLKITGYQYSLNGGNRWFNATVTPALSVITPSRQGIDYTVQWQAGKDINTQQPAQAIGEEVRFRVSAVELNTPRLSYHIDGPNRRLVVSAVSSPFRIRSTACIWPENPFITRIQPTPPVTPTKIRFEGDLLQWDRQLTGITFTWDFGGVITAGTFADHTFTKAGTYVVTLTVSQAPCPNTRTDFATTTVTIIAPELTMMETVYLPAIQKAGTSATALPGEPSPTLTESSAEGADLSSLGLSPAAPGQLTGLLGETGPAGTTLRWNPAPPDDGVQGYRVYRAGVGSAAWQQVADLPAGNTEYTDPADGCNTRYFVTAYNDQGESPPSISSYYGPPCQLND